MLELLENSCSITGQCWNCWETAVPSQDSVGTVEKQLFHHMTVLELLENSCSITGQCWNCGKMAVPKI